MGQARAAQMAIEAYQDEDAGVIADDSEASSAIDNYEYGAFGEEDGQQIELASTPFRYTGRWGGYSDADVGGVLNWNRWYGPEAGRWVSRDPIGIFGGINSYVYVLNQATLQIDPLGLRGLDMRFLIPRPNPEYEKWKRERDKEAQRGQERENARWNKINDDSNRRTKESACFGNEFWPCVAKEFLPKPDDGAGNIVDTATYGACWTCKTFKQPVACGLCLGVALYKAAPIVNCAKDANQKCGCGGRK